MANCTKEPKVKLHQAEHVSAGILRCPTVMNTKTYKEMKITAVLMIIQLSGATLMIQLNGGRSAVCLYARTVRMVSRNFAWNVSQV